MAYRKLEESYPYLILDARYEQVREAGVIRSRAVLVAIGVDWNGRRNVLAVELAHRESATSGKEFLQRLVASGLRWLEERQDLEEAQRDWVEDNSAETLCVLPAAAPASPALEEHQPAGATQGRDQAAHARGADLP